MYQTTVGAMIKTIRKQQKISQAALCQGLCSVQTLSKLERDNCETDALLLDVFLQRLGKSPTKLEFILPWTEYRKIKLRDLIETLIWKKKKAKAEVLLNYYEQQFSSSNSLQQMYCLRTRANLVYQIDRNLSLAKELLSQAIQQTLPNFRFQEGIPQRISSMEMENLLLLARIALEESDETLACPLLQTCLSYIENHVTDEEEQAKIFSKAAWLQARLLFLQGQEFQALALCETAIEQLRRNNICYFMLPLLQLMASVSYEPRHSGTQNHWKEWYLCLKELYEEFGVPWYCHDDLFHNCSKREYHLDYELIRGERLAQGYTQAELSDAIYQSPESLSRVETGKVSPSKKTFEEFMQRFGWDRKRYQGVILVNSFEWLELKRNIDRQLALANYSEAKQLVEQLKRHIDCRLIQNRQEIEFQEAILSSHFNQCSKEELYDALKRILSYTYSLDSETRYRYPLITESVILNCLCITLSSLQKREEALAIYDKIISCFLKSKTDRKYHYRSLGLLLENRSITLFQWSIRNNMEKIKQSISYELQCDCGMSLPAELTAYTLAFDNTAEQQEKKGKKIKQAYQMSQLFYQTQYEKWIEKYRKKYLES